MVHSGRMRSPVWTLAPVPTRRRRRHARSAAPGDRRALELAGWRTLLEYRENHVRDQHGTLVAVMPQWTGEAELVAGTPRAGRPAVLVAAATGETPAAVWAELRRRTAEMAGPA
jgi:hypothetical protein